MGGYMIDDDWEYSSPSPITLVLVGRTGNGKSATGNSIVGSKKFESKRSCSGVTTTSKLKTTVLADGRVVNVIDTPGLFDSSIDFEFIGKEVVSCIDLARDGIDAVLVVFSVCNRFSEEEKSAISSLLTLFGRKIYDYIIVVFTGGELEEEGKTLEDFLCGCQEALKEMLRLCGNRYLLFDNKTKDETKRAIQVQKLLSIVNNVALKNGGKPYTNEMFTEFKKCTRGSEEHEQDKQFKHIFEMVKSKLKETNQKLEQLLEEERAARVEAERRAEDVQKKSDEEIRKMRVKLQNANKRIQERLQIIEEEKLKKEQKEKDKEETPRQAEKGGCIIL